MANEAEVTLNIKAEYKQALSSIALLAKALEALQKQATIMLNMGTGSSDGKGTTPQYSTAEIEKLKVAMTDTAKAVAAVSGEMVKLGTMLAQNGVPPERVREVADLASKYSALAESVNAATTALNTITGAGDNTSPQIGILTQQISLLQEQVVALQKQLDEVRSTPAPAPGEAVRPGTSASADTASHVRTMSWLQQARAAKRLAKSISELSEQLSNMSKDAEEGNLNLMDMAGNVVEFAQTMRSAMAPVGLFLLALEAIQEGYNKHMRQLKRAKDAEADMQASLKLSADAYNSVLEAKNAYYKQQERKSEIEELKSQYKALNDEVERGLTLLKKSFDAEIARLSLIEDEAQHAETLKKADLGRELMKGVISQDEYEQALIELNKGSKTRKATDARTRAEVEARQADARYSKQSTVYDEKVMRFAEIDALFSQFIPVEELEMLQKNRADLEARASERAAKMKEQEAALEKLGGLSAVLESEKAMETWLELGNLQKEAKAAEEALAAYNAKVIDRIGTADIEEYAQRRQQTSEKHGIAKAERDRATNDVEAALRDKEKAQRELAETEARSAQEIRQAGEYADSELESLRVRREEKKRQEERDKQYRKLQKDIANMTNAEIREAQKELAKVQTSDSVNHKELAQFERISSLYSDTLRTRKEQGRQTVQEVRQIANEGKGNAVTEWALKNAETYATSPLTSKQAATLIERSTQALQTKSQQDDEIMAALLEQARFAESVTKRQQGQITQLKRDLASERRKQAVILRNMR